MEDHEKIRDLVNLANSTQRLMMQLKDLSGQIIQVNKDIRDVVGQMEEKDDVIIAASGSGKQVIARFDLSQAIEVPEDPDEIVILEPLEVIDTWEKVKNNFSEAITEKAIQLADRISKLIEESEANIKVLKRFIEDFKSLMETMVEDFHANELQMQRLEAQLAEVHENLDASQTILSDLNVVRDIFPHHESLNPEELLMRNHERQKKEEQENGPIEENRPFPNAWT